MKTDVVVDYATPYMDAKRALDNMHTAMLEKDYELAEELAIGAITDAKLALIAVRHLKEKYGR